ncbi:MAG: STAS domain-containing protein [Actinobacteria bacterium]|nr:STAS domain-containing protein [Actinomycetota bacterium]
MDFSRPAGLPAWPAIPSRGVLVEALRLRPDQRGPALVVSVDGDVDIVTSRSLDDCLRQARREGQRHIILDLAGVEFMDTSALAVIVGHWKELTGVGGTLALAGASYQSARSLWITGLAHRIPMFDTADEAVRAAAAAEHGTREAG